MNCWNQSNGLSVLSSAPLAGKGIFGSDKIAVANKKPQWTTRSAWKRLLCFVANLNLRLKNATNLRISWT